jgi:hypothetical protein
MTTVHPGNEAAAQKGDVERRHQGQDGRGPA